MCCITSKMAEKDAYGVLLMLLSLFGTLFYSFIFIFVFKHKEKTYSTFHVLLLNLSVADCTVLLIFAVFIPVNMFCDSQIFGEFIGEVISYKINKC